MQQFVFTLLESVFSPGAKILSHFMKTFEKYMLKSKYEMSQKITGDDFKKTFNQHYFLTFRSSKHGKSLIVKKISEIENYFNGLIKISHIYSFCWHRIFFCCLDTKISSVMSKYLNFGTLLTG